MTWRSVCPRRSADHEPTYSADPVSQLQSVRMRTESSDQRTWPFSVSLQFWPQRPPHNELMQYKPGSSQTSRKSPAAIEKLALGGMSAGLTSGNCAGRTWSACDMLLQYWWTQGYSVNEFTSLHLSHTQASICSLYDKRSMFQPLGCKNTFHKLKLGTWQSLLKSASIDSNFTVQICSDSDLLHDQSSWSNHLN